MRWPWSHPGPAADQQLTAVPLCTMRGIAGIDTASFWTISLAIFDIFPILNISLGLHYGRSVSDFSHV